MRLDRLFDPAAKARITAAVAAAEATTTGQIVPVVVARSADYQPFWVALGPFAAAFALATLLEALGLLAPSAPIARLIGVLSWLAIAALPPFQRWTVRRHFAGATRQRALAAFAAHGVHRTAEGTGVLVFVSLYERKAIVLGDRAIHARLGESGWQAAIQLLTDRLRVGDAAGGLVAAIAHIGEQLAREFPRPQGQPLSNELPDELHVDRD